MPAKITATMKGLLGHPVHHFATLWRIERVDSVVMLFTDHDRPILYTDKETEELYVPAGAFDASAREKQAGIREANTEVNGVLTAEAITDDDVRGGRYAGAKVIEILIDYRFPYAGYFLRNIYYAAEITYTREVWKVQLSAQPAWMRKEVGTVLSPICRHVLGQGICGLGVSLETYRVGGTVQSIQERRRVFRSADVAGYAPTYFSLGAITWTTGVNTGLTVEVLEHGEGGRLTLPVQTGFEIDIGDEFTIVPGCDHIMSTCSTKFNNLVNFGGFPGMPGTDKLIGGLI